MADPTQNQSEQIQAPTQQEPTAADLQNQAARLDLVGKTGQREAKASAAEQKQQIMLQREEHIQRIMSKRNQALEQNLLEQQNARKRLGATRESLTRAFTNKQKASTINGIAAAFVSTVNNEGTAGFNRMFNGLMQELNQDVQAQMQNLRLASGELDREMNIGSQLSKDQNVLQHQLMDLKLGAVDEMMAAQQARAGSAQDASVYLQTRAQIKRAQQANIIAMEKASASSADQSLRRDIMRADLALKRAKVGTEQAREETETFKGEKVLAETDRVRQETKLLGKNASIKEQKARQDLVKQGLDITKKSRELKAMEIVGSDFGEGKKAIIADSTVRNAFNTKASRANKLIGDLETMKQLATEVSTLRQSNPRSADTKAQRLRVIRAQFEKSLLEQFGASVSDAEMKKAMAPIGFAIKGTPFKKAAFIRMDSLRQAMEKGLTDELRALDDGFRKAEGKWKSSNVRKRSIGKSQEQQVQEKNLTGVRGALLKATGIKRRTPQTSAERNKVKEKGRRALQAEVQKMLDSGTPLATIKKSKKDIVREDIILGEVFDEVLNAQSKR